MGLGRNPIQQAFPAFRGAVRANARDPSATNTFPFAQRHSPASTTVHGTIDAIHGPLVYKVGKAGDSTILFNFQPYGDRREEER